MRDALDFWPGIAHGVKGFFGAGEVAVGRHPPAARLAKINVTGEFTDDQNVQPGNQLGLEAGSLHQFFVTNGRAEVGKQAQVFAQAQNGLFRAQRAVQLVVFPVAHSAEQNGIRRFGQLERGLWQRMPKRLVSGPAHQGGFQLELQIQHMEHTHGLRDNFGANAITG